MNLDPVAPSIPPEPTDEQTTALYHASWLESGVKDDERARFEAWAEATTPFGTQRQDDGYYVSSWLQNAWNAWSTRAALASIQQAGSAAPEPTNQGTSMQVTDEMVTRFLCWKLPEDFAPDAGITFKRVYNEKSPYGPMNHEPVGTNLLNAPQARAMLEHVLGSAAPAPATETLTDAADAAKYRALHTPEVEDFIKAVEREAMFQREKWGADGDAGKTDTDWFWLLGYLGGKAIRPDSTPEKQLHHIITTAAACLNWHAARVGAYTTMRPGIAEPASEKLLMQAGAKENSNAR